MVNAGGGIGEEIVFDKTNNVEGCEVSRRQKRKG